MDSLILTLTLPLAPNRSGSKLRRLDQLGDPLKRQRVALRSAADNNARSDARNVGMMPERLSLVHVGNMHLDDRTFEGVQRIEDGDRRMGEGGGIDDDAGGALASAVNPVDQLVFAIALMELDRKPEFCADATAVRFDIGQRLAAVNLRLALAEQV